MVGEGQIRSPTTVLSKTVNLAVQLPTPSSATPNSPTFDLMLSLSLPSIFH